MADKAIPTQVPTAKRKVYKNDISFVTIDCDENYFSTKEQIRLRDRSYFVDKSIAKSVKNSNTAVGFFGNEKITTLMTGALGHNYTTGSYFDTYRNGIEITNINQWTAGVVKISAGTPGHLVSPLCLGVSEISIVDKNFYKDIEVFNPTYFIELQEEDKPIENIITFPIVTNDSNQLENFVLNGIIEPFPIRPIISNFTINVPFEPQGVRGTFGNGNPSMLLASDYVVSVDYNEPERKNNNVFLDLAEDLTISNDEGTVTRHLGSSIFFFNDGVNYLSPFEDKVNPRGEDLDIVDYSADLKEVVSRMKPLGLTYLSKKEKSASTGFMYDNTSQIGGTDSIAYGGMSY
jgi:hypothetical protein